MTAPVFLHSAIGTAQPGDVLQLTAAEGRHAVSAMRVCVNERVDLVDGQGTRAQGVVALISGRDSCSVRVSDVSTEPEPVLSFVVAQSLLKGEHDERAVDALTQVGVDAIIPLQTERCVVRWDSERAERGQARWEAASGAAARQSRRARWPVIHRPVDIKAVSDLCAQVDLALVLEAQASLPIGDLTMPAGGKVLVIVGPEGGLSDGELALLTKAGARPTRMGAEVLRGSAAGFAAVAACLAGSRWCS